MTNPRYIRAARKRIARIVKEFQRRSAMIAQRTRWNKASFRAMTQALWALDDDSAYALASRILEKEEGLREWLNATTVSLDPEFDPAQELASNINITGRDD